ncbi:hypothetical protein CAS74_001155 [Pichia kudriavzevii]|uniref:Uncharacterized protein n=1 Tax=Pichia kudriavzevii TaxID=4909 RepID=A0A1Z8JVZ7_PICKU|nr:hypothetical protein CAS74_001155 [Pichia kudriavzevii]
MTDELFDLEIETSIALPQLVHDPLSDSESDFEDDIQPLTLRFPKRLSFDSPVYAKNKTTSSG